MLLACIGGYKWDGNPREKRPETGLLKVRGRESVCLQSCVCSHVCSHVYVVMCVYLCLQYVCTYIYIYTIHPPTVPPLIMHTRTPTSNIQIAIQTKPNIYLHNTDAQDPILNIHTLKLSTHPLIKQMRKTLGLYANLRPAKVLPQLVSASTLKPEVVSGVDIMVRRYTYF